MELAKRNFLLLHFIVFIWGWTAVLAKIITLPTLQLVWIRVPIAFLGMVIYAAVMGISLRTSAKNILQIIGVGIVVGLHWMCFYGSVKASNVSITLACFSTGTLFTSLIEPLIYKRRMLWYEVLFGLIVIGVLIMLFRVEAHYFLGIVLGICAAFTSSMMAVLNSILSRKDELRSELISIYEMIGCWICISVVIFFMEPETATYFNVSIHDWFYLLVLAIGCTTIPYIIGIVILKTISPYTMTLTLNLETIYGILFAFFIFKGSETMSTQFYIGAAIILSIVFADAYIKKYVK